MKRKWFSVWMAVLMVLVFAQGLAAAEKAGAAQTGKKEKKSFLAFVWSGVKEDARLTWIGMKSGVYTCANLVTGNIAGASVEVAALVGKVTEEYTGQSNPLSEAAGHGTAGLIIIGTRIASDVTGNENVAKTGKIITGGFEVVSAVRSVTSGGLTSRSWTWTKKGGAIPLVKETKRMEEMRAAFAQAGTAIIDGTDLVIQGLSESDEKNSTVTVTQEGDIITVMNKKTGEVTKISRKALDNILATCQREMQKMMDSESVEDRLPMKVPGQGRSSGKTSGKPVTLDKIEIVR